MIKVFETIKDYNTYAPNGLPSGEMGYVIDDKSVHFRTNNIDGETKNYSFTQSKEEQDKSEVYTENGDYTITPDEGKALASVNVSINVPSVQQVEMTQEQYDALGTKDNNTIYLITE